ncbi:MAG: hypothetical protein NXH75_13090 [Halobacteriovoraceae bacterium]|nr:hypothetical protein [Halobacteriovoraceae bacterium]
MNLTLQRLITFTMLSFLTFSSGCYRELSMIRPGKAISSGKGTLFKRVLEDIGEVRLAGSCEALKESFSMKKSQQTFSPKEVLSTKAPILKVVFGTKRPFWREVQGHILLETLAVSAHGMIRNDRFSVKGKGPSGHSFIYSGLFDNQKNLITIKSISYETKNNQNVDAPFKLRTCTYEYKLPKT